VLVLGNSVLVIVVRNDHESPEDRFVVTRTRITKLVRLASEIFLSDLLKNTLPMLRRTQHERKIVNNFKSRSP
jgi:hypothetical protein